MPTATIELCTFYRDICAKTISISDLDHLQTNIIIILYKLEKIFLPTFFDAMVHKFSPFIL